MSDHNEHEAANTRNLLISVLMNLTITVAEGIGGVVSGSLALLGDAFHNFMGMLFASANLVLCSRQVTLQQGS